MRGDELRHIRGMAAMAVLLFASILIVAAVLHMAGIDLGAEAPCVSRSRRGPMPPGTV